MSEVIIIAQFSMEWTSKGKFTLFSKVYRGKKRRWEWIEMFGSRKIGRYGKWMRARQSQAYAKEGESERNSRRMWEGKRMGEGWEEEWKKIRITRATERPKYKKMRQKPGSTKRSTIVKATRKPNDKILSEYWMKNEEKLLKCKKTERNIGDELLFNLISI